MLHTHTHNPSHSVIHFSYLHPHDDRTFKELLYGNRQSFEHFKIIRNIYYRETHKNGSVYVKDSMMLRTIRHQVYVLCACTFECMCVEKFVCVDRNRHKLKTEV